MKKKQWMKAAAMAAALAMMAALAGCSNGNGEGKGGGASDGQTADAGGASGGGNGGEGKLYGITYWTESDFFKTIAASITEAAQADGSRTVAVNAEQDSAKQIQIVEDFITQGVDAVFLNPVDRDAVTPALELLNEAGIPIINFDSSVARLDMVGRLRGYG